MGNDSSDQASKAMNWQDAARLIDHTLLKPDATPAQIKKLCAEARAFGFYSVMINPSNIALCVAELQGSPVVVGTVIGFPLGATTTAAKLAEAADALKLGATELDMVINVGALKSGQVEYVVNEVRALAELCHSKGALLKVIIETVLLTTEEKQAACKCVVTAGADFVKTSTGFASAGATVEDIALMRAAVGSKIGVKAAGGIRTAADLIKMAKAGATRVGASASVAMVRELGAPQTLQG